MGKDWGPRSICPHLLLIAMAIQGLTPDVHDLASSSLFQMLFPALNDSKFGRDSTSSPDCDQDKMPDEVCVPDRPASKGLRRWADVSPGIGILPTSTGERSPQSGRLHASSARDILARVENLPLSLCRLTC